MQDGRVNRAGTVGAVVLALVAAGCGAGSRPEIRSVAITTTEPTAGRYAISAPARLIAGEARIHFTNRGTLPHDAQLVRVDGVHGAQEVIATIRTDGAATPEWLHYEGGVGTVAHGHSADTDLALLAGHYFVIDTGIDEDSIALAAAGAIAPLEVAEGASVVRQTVARPTAIVTAVDYGFVVQGLRSGTTSIHFVNAGAQPHQFEAAPIRAGRTLDDVKRSLAPSGSAQEQASPLDLTNAVWASVIDAGKSEIATVTVRPGRYAFFCLQHDRQGGPAHTGLGMLQEVRVT